MERLTRWVLGHGRLVALGWILLTLAGGYAASQISDALSMTFDDPGSESTVANQRIVDRFGAGGAGAPLVLVARTGDADAAGPAFERVRDAVRGSRLVTDESLTEDETTAALLYLPLGPGGTEENLPAEAAAQRAAAAAEVAGEPLGVTGALPLAEGDSGGSGPGLLIETLLGGVGALVVLAFVFASFLALVPLLIAAVSILTTFLLLLGLTTFTEINFTVQFLVGLIGLGVAIDYSLFVVVRWREELAGGADGDDAIVKAMRHAGSAVVFSGTTVAIGLLALVVVPVPFIRSIGFGGLLIPLVSVLASVTLLPVVLHRFGHRLAWPRRRTESHASRGWTRWAGAIVHRPWPAAVAGLAVLLVLAGVAATSLRPGDPDLDSLSSSGPARAALVQLEESGLGGGPLTTAQVVAPADAGPELRDALAGVEGVRGAVLETRGGTALVDVIPRTDLATDAGTRILDRVRDTATGVSRATLVGGKTAQTQDLTDAIYSSFPLMLVLISLITVVLLARAFRSLLLPIKAVLLNVLSVGTAFGVVVLVWQEGFGSELIWGIPATGAITTWIPLAVFAFLYGLSMDYEVFILARIREERDVTGSTDEAVIRGLGRTGRLVTSAALILFLAFVALGASPGTEIKILATGLASGIILDATVVRALLVPALVKLFGEWNWWMPAGLARLLRVRQP